MARGDYIEFDETVSKLSLGTLGLTASTEWSVALVSVGVDVITSTQVDPRLGFGDLTEVSTGADYTAGGQALTLANTDSAGVFLQNLSTAVHTSGIITFNSSDTGPTDVKTAIPYRSGSTGNEAHGYYDLTNDGGTTPVSLVAGNLNLDFATGPGEILSITST